MDWPIKIRASAEQTAEALTYVRELFFNRFNRIVIENRLYGILDI